VIDAFARNKHKGDWKRAFVGENVFLRNGVGVILHRCCESAPGFFSLVSDSAIGIQREFRVDGKELVSQKNHRVRYFSATETVLPVVAAAGKGILQKTLQRDLAQRAARFRTAQDVLQSLRSVRHLAAGKLDFTKLLLNFSQCLL